MMHEQLEMTQPKAPELEVSVLGALMLERDAIDEVADILKPEMFYDPKHVEIYRVIERMHRNSEPIDMLTVTTKLRSTGKDKEAGGIIYVSDLTDKVASAANIKSHALVIL